MVLFYQSCPSSNCVIDDQNHRKILTNIFDRIAAKSMNEIKK